MDHFLETVEEIAPQRRKMSYEEYLEFAGGSQIVEWVEGGANYTAKL